MYETKYIDTSGSVTFSKYLKMTSITRDKYTRMDNIIVTILSFVTKEIFLKKIITMGNITHLMKQNDIGYL